ncbi:MAG: hypothetical protein JWM98_1118 [Thermoleophilia bacterium]|nr:hypothetical protein [Thermoleophilia bacterium]
METSLAAVGARPRTTFAGRLTGGVPDIASPWPSSPSAPDAPSPSPSPSPSTSDVDARGGAAQLAARFAPIIHGRQSGGRDDWPRTDRALELLAEVRHLPDGGTRLDYSVLFANEDGGTSTPALLADWGRTTDYELEYTVQLDAAGAVVPGSETYQGARHQWGRFDGPHDGDHAVLHVSTGNNMVAPGPGGSRLAISRPTQVVELGATDRAADALDVMVRAPSSWSAMAEEVRREGKVGHSHFGLFGRTMQDPQRYVYVAGVPHDGARLWVHTRDGRALELSLPHRHLVPDGRSMAVPLPDGLLGREVTEIFLASAPLGGDYLRSATVLLGDDSPVVFDGITLRTGPAGP